MATDMLIKQMPEDLKAWIAEQARQHHRSMNREAISLLETARAQRAGPPRAGRDDVAALLARYRALPVLDRRSADEILGYDASGLPA